MENQYGIAITNKYQLFLDDDEGDPLELLRQQEEALKKKDEKSKKDTKNEKAKSAKNKQNKKVAVVQEEQRPKYIEDTAPRREGSGRPRGGFRGGDRDNEPRGERGERGGRTFRNTNREVPPRRERVANPEGEKSPEFRDRVERPEGRRGRGGPRGGRGGRGRGGFDRFGKREFERHSGSDKTSGIKPMDKRDGAGAHNWGTIKDDLEEQLTTETTEDRADTSLTEDTENQDPNKETTGETEGAEGGEGEDKTPIDEAALEMTLDEYKAQQAKSRMQAKFNIRRAGEGCDENQWKRMHKLKKAPVVDDDEEESEEEEDEDDEFDRHGRAKKTVPIAITFADTPRRGRGGRRGGGRGGRGGRGGGGGGGGGGGMGEMRGGRGEMGGEMRGGGRGGGQRGRGREVAAPNIVDENDFPSLVKTAAS